jgi:hypothetical protein
VGDQGAVLKLAAVAPTPGAVNPPGGLGGATGIRYLTLTVTGLAGLVEELAAAGTPIIKGPVSMGPAVSIAIVEDPEGNWVEFLEHH